METRLQHFESLYLDIQNENTILRAELEQRDVDVAALLSSKTTPIDSDKSEDQEEVMNTGSNSAVELEVVVDGSGEEGGASQSLLLSTMQLSVVPPKKLRELILR